jgi:hypothetical protein
MPIQPSAFNIDHIIQIFILNSNEGVDLRHLGHTLKRNFISMTYIHTVLGPMGFVQVGKSEVALSKGASCAIYKVEFKIWEKSSVSAAAL